MPKVYEQFQNYVQSVKYTITCWIKESNLAVFFDAGKAANCNC